MARKRFIQVDGELVEVGQDYIPPASTDAKSFVVGDSHYDGLQTSDGVNISSRAKHREYMKRHGLTTIDDFQGEWKKREKERIDVRNGVDPRRKEDIARALHKLSK